MRGRFDILAICETKLDKTYPDSQFAIHGFRMCRSDRNIYGGGLMVFVRSDLCLTVIKELGDQNGTDASNFRTEHIILKVKVAKSWLTVMAIYRPPTILTSQWKFELSMLFEVVTTFSNDVVCVGDFNSNLLDPKDGGHLEDLMEVYGLKNLIKLPTRIGKTSSTLLDLILTNNTRRIFSSGVVNADISDHTLIYAILRATAPRLRSCKIHLRSLKNFDQDLFLHNLHNVPFHVIEVFDDIDDKQYVLELLYLDILNGHAPIKQEHILGNQIPFMNEQWRKAIRHRNKLGKKFTHQRTDANYAEYKKQRNKCTSIRRKAIKHYFKNKSETENSRAFWEAYRPFMHSRSSKQANDITLIENDVVITDKKELAELFNDYFVLIVDDVQDTKEHNFGNEFSAHPSIRAIMEENRRKNAIHNFNFKYTNKTQVEKLLLNICGHGTITPRLLKESASAISGPLAELMNESIKQCKYPSRCKMGQVTPLFKKK